MTALALDWFDDEGPRDLRRWAIAAIVVVAVHAGAIAAYLYVHEPDEIGDDSSFVSVDLSPIQSDIDQPEIAPVPETHQKEVEAPPPDEAQTVVAPPKEQPV
jgi:periplasmic protein TonB